MTDSDERASATGAEGPAAVSGIALLRLDGLRALVVDDEKDAREIVQVMLEERGAIVATAASAAEALERLRAFRPDVLISDIGMPEVDGYELMRLVRRLPPEQGGRVPAAALTAFARRSDRLQALLAGYQTHVAKPVEPDELIAVIASIVPSRA
jgi:CheY-like chemotaxis protein